MKTRPFGIALLILAVICLIIGLAPRRASETPVPAVPSAPASAPDGDELIGKFDPSPTLDDIGQEIARSGGDLHHQSVRVAVGVATGQFQHNPAAERALRRTAEMVLNHLLVPQDTVSLFGFERGIGHAVWNVPYDTPGRQSLTTLWNGLSPGAGGIDFNSIVRSAIGPLHPAANRNTVIVLVSPYDQSEDPAQTSSTAQPPAGLDVAALQAALQQSGLQFSQKITLPYHVPHHAEDAGVYVTLLLPAHFAGDALPADRLTLLQQEAGAAPVAVNTGTGTTAPASAASVPADPTPAPSHQGGWIGFGVLLLTAGGVLLALHRPSASHLKIALRGSGSGGKEFDGPWKSGEVICQIVGADAPASEHPEIRLPGQPPVRLADVVQRPGGVVMESNFRMSGPTGQASQAGLALTRGAPQAVTITDSAPGAPGLKATDFTVPLEVTLQ